MPEAWLPAFAAICAGIGYWFGRRAEPGERRSGYRPEDTGATPPAHVPNQRSSVQPPYGISPVDPWPRPGLASHSLPVEHTRRG